MLGAAFAPSGSGKCSRFLSLSANRLNILGIHLFGAVKAFLANVFQPFFPHCCRPTIKNTLHGHLGVSLVSVKTHANKCDRFRKVCRFFFFNFIVFSLLFFFFFFSPSLLLAGAWSAGAGTGA